MHLALLLADVTFSTEALVLVIAVVGALWSWSLSLVQARARDLLAAIMQLRAEAQELRRQNQGLYEQVVALEREVAALKARLPG